MSFFRRRTKNEERSMETTPTPTDGSLDSIALRVKASQERCEDLIASLADEVAALGRLNVAQLSAFRDELSRSDDEDLMKLVDRVHQISWSKELLTKAGRGLGAQSPLMQLRLGTPDGTDFSGELHDAIEARKFRKREAKEAADREAEDRLLAEHPEIARIIARKVDEAVPLGARPRRRIEGSYTGPGQVGHPIVEDEDE